MRVNKKGMIGFPFRLAIAFLILALCVPTLIHMVDGFQQNAEIDSVSIEAQKISNTISRTYYSGIGSVCTLDVSIDNDCYIKIGGEGTDAYSIGIFLGDNEKNKLYLERPSVKIIGNGLEISGNRTLMFECIKIDNICGVEVTSIA